jgi:hypothetical protein
MRRGFGQVPTAPLPPAPGGFCPTISIACPSGTVIGADASGCPNYPCVSTAAATTTVASPFAFLTNVDPILGLPYWVWIVGGAVVLYAMKK